MIPRSIENPEVTEEIYDQRRRERRNWGTDRQMWYYIYECSPSTETRGRRESHNGGCMMPCLRKSKTMLIDSGEKIQGSPCPNCSRRKRFDEGDLCTIPMEEIEIMDNGIHLRNCNTTVGWPAGCFMYYDMATYALSLHRRMWASIYLNSGEEIPGSSEYTPNLIEQNAQGGE